MAIMKAKAQVTTAKQGESEGADVFLRALRDGSIIKCDWKQAAVMGGHGFFADSGALTTGFVSGGSAAILDNDRPRFLISIPQGIAFIPLRIGVHCQHGTVGDEQEAEILIAVDQDTEFKTDGTGAATPIYNMNTLVAKSSACTCRNTFSATIGTAVLDIELARRVIQFDKATSGQTSTILDLVYEPENPPVINGPATFLVYYGGYAAFVTDGSFVDAAWLEFEENTFRV